MNATANRQPLVSIVLPTYKRAHVLPHAIRSVLKQSYTNWELIVVDDNSPDETPQVVKSFCDARIRYARNDPNLKLPRALNKGFSLASGEYLTWTSDDNMYRENAIEKMVERLDEGACDFVYADYFLFADIDAHGNAVDARHDRLPGRLQLEKGNHIGACFMYTRKLYESIGDYDPELFLVEDYDYFMRAAKRFTFCHIAEPLYFFRRHDDALYCSRFCEVKASDVLVRYKNGLLDDSTALETVVTLILRNDDDIKQPLLNWMHHAVMKHSYRLSQLHNKLTSNYLRRKLRNELSTVLGDYRSGKKTFKDARDALCETMQRFATIEYRPS